MKGPSPAIQSTSKPETKPSANNEYEHLELLVETDERPGEVPSKRRKAVDKADSKATSAPRYWTTRRQRDGKVGHLGTPPKDLV